LFVFFLAAFQFDAAVEKWKIE